LIINFTECFKNATNITSAAPELWKRVPEPTGTDCYLNDINLSNYDDIPEGWGGPARSSSSSSSSV